ncbi:MAG: M23 family metallopeptidase [Bacteroidetes bacterium]|nr:M23 family metallopeptidase [Bacteroidota bacterium]
MYILFKNYLSFITILFCITGMTMTLNGQTQTYPQDYFRSPIDSPIYLSGNFCTLRNDHFHYGIDITTYEKEGMPVLAAADGYVSRVKVWPYGYGKAIYIDHPNGYTTVYGHLNKYNDFINTAVKDSQYAKENFEVEFFPKPNEWQVKKGDIIAYSGNSGGSSGPHIHFEIRDTKTEEIINPLLFGLDILDTISPEIKNIALYQVHNGQTYIYTILKADTSENDTINIPAGEVSLSAIINDYTTFKRIAFNPYEINLSVNNQKIYECQFERFSFDQQKIVNVHIDYEQYWNTGQRYQKLYLDDGNELPFLNKQFGRGWFDIKENEFYKVAIFARDLKGNYIECTIV